MPVPVVGVVRIPGPASAQDLKEASSSMLIFGIGSCSNGSGCVAERVTNSGLGVGAGTMLGSAPGVPTGSGWAPVGWRSARNYFKVFSNLRPLSTMHRIIFMPESIVGCFRPYNNAFLSTLSGYSK